MPFGSLSWHAGTARLQAACLVILYCILTAAVSVLVQTLLTYARGDAFCCLRQGHQLDA